MLRARPILLPLAVAGVLLGCEASQLYVGADTVIGLNAGVNTERTAGHFIFGYDRNFATVIPKSVPGVVGNPDPNAREAMSALSCSKVSTDGIFLSGFKESLATGGAAKAYAEKIQQGQTTTMFNCFKQ